jgi:hypothetical protein
MVEKLDNNKNNSFEWMFPMGTPRGGARKTDNAKKTMPIAPIAITATEI